VLSVPVSVAPLLAPRCFVAVAGRAAAVQQASRICRRWRANAQAYAVLQSEAAFLSNLNVGQNLVLPSNWQQPQPAAQLLHQARELFQGWQLDGPTLAELLPLRPYELSETSRRTLVLLQAALCQPQRLLILPDWFAEPPLEDTPWWQLQNRVFQSQQWLYLASRPATLTPAVAWVTGKIGAEGNVDVE
jgi:ABC-type uncharacterized transport system YnjBCD ATPase subunit